MTSNPLMNIMRKRNCKNKKEIMKALCLVHRDFLIADFVQFDFDATDV